MNSEQSSARSVLATGARAAARVERLSPLLLGLLVLAAYLPSLDGGFLNWDDPWLIEHNRVLADGSFASLRAIWTDFSFATRLSLGAEYLPVRDTALWVELRVFGLHAPLLRCAELGAYLGAVLLVRGALLRTLPNKRSAEVAAWIFALHPVHVESVAWLSGEKDVLAMLFVGAALFVHAGRSRSRIVAVPALLLLAHLSKSMTVIAGGLLLASDFVSKRRPDPKLYGLVLLVAALALAADLRVGNMVGMTEIPAGGTRSTALMTMGSVWLRYVWLLLWPGALSLVHDVPTKTAWDLPSLLGYAAILGSSALALGSFVKRGARLPILACVWLWLPLLPVSQILFPLQNRMADRYLFLSALSVGLAVAMLVEKLPAIGLAVSATLMVAFTGASAWRSALFSNDVAVFGDATSKTRWSPVAPYQLAQALEDAGDEDGARAAYEEVLRRAPGTVEPARRATNNVARLYVRENRLDDARRVLERGRALWPEDPKISNNLRKVIAREASRNPKGAP